MSTPIEKLLKDLIDSAEKPINVLQELAQYAENAERYKDMVIFMQKLVERQTDKKQALTSEQRNLLSVAYKNVVGGQRQAWRSVESTIDTESDVPKALVDKYRKVIEDELKKTCEQVIAELKILSDQNQERIEADDGGDKEERKNLQESQVFYLKMSGDYYRYLTEVFKDWEESKIQCRNFYQTAMDLAKSALEATHPTRLGLALNFSVCYYEILEKPTEACQLAKSAFDEAIEKLDSLNDVSYKDSTLIMQLLRDNLTIWNQSDDGKDAANKIEA